MLTKSQSIIVIYTQIIHTCSLVTINNEVYNHKISYRPIYNTINKKQFYIILQAYTECHNKYEYILYDNANAQGQIRYNIETLTFYTQAIHIVTRKL